MHKKILICDDDAGILELMELIIEEFGFVPLLEARSVNVLKTLEQERPDLLLLDIWMPVLSGDQLLKSIKDNGNFTDVPVIMYSASTDGLAIATKAGADDYIAKPFDMNVLHSKILALLQ